MGEDWEKAWMEKAWMKQEVTDQDVPTKENEVSPRFTSKVNMSNKLYNCGHFKNITWNLKSICKQSTKVV